MLGLSASVSMTSLSAASSLLASTSTRYQLPDTDYYKDLSAGMPLHTLAGYAHAEYRARLIGNNLAATMPVPLSGPHDYSPFGAGLVERMREDIATAHDFTGRWDRALVASPGTAILGLGSAPVNGGRILQARTAMPIMAGKAKYFLWTAGVSTDPLCIETRLTSHQEQELRKMQSAEEFQRAKHQLRLWRAEAFASHVLGLSNNYGFINVEDAQGKDLPIILGALDCLRGECAVWSDDKQGTGVITAAAMLSWADLTDRKLEDVRVVLMGAGAGAMGVYDELVNNGVKPENILVTDSRGVLHEERDDIESDPFKVKMRMGIPVGTELEDFAKGADALINLGVKESLTDDIAKTERITRSLAEHPFFGPMTNPDPGITPEQLHRTRPDAFYGSGNQNYENPVNNFTAFGYIGAGALMARAGGVGSIMTVAAARGIHQVAKLGPPDWLKDRLPESQREYGRHWLVPHPTDIRLIQAEAGAVAKAAAREGLALMFSRHPVQRDFERFDAEIDRQVALRIARVQQMRQSAEERGRRYYQLNYAKRYRPFTLPGETRPSFEVSPTVDFAEFEGYARAMGVKEERWKDFLTGEGQLTDTALTDVLALTVKKMTADSQTNEQVQAHWQRELEVIVQIAQIHPALGMALALRRSRVRNFDTVGTTVFHREAVLRTVLRHVPEARKSIYEFDGIPDL